MGRKDISEKRKSEIIRAYFKVLLVEGVEGASIRKIADYLGIRPSHILHYFKTKDEIITSSMKYLVDLYELQIRILSNSDLDLEDHLSFILHEGLFPKALSAEFNMVNSAMIYMSNRKSEIARVCSQMFTRFKKHLENELKMMMDAGIIAQNDPEAIANILTTLNIGFTSMQGIQYNSDEYEKLYSNTFNYAIKILNPLKPVKPYDEKYKTYLLQEFQESYE